VRGSLATLSVLQPLADISSTHGFGNILEVIFIGFDWPNLLAPSVRLLMRDQIGAEEISPTLLLPRAPLIPPVAADDAPRAILDGRIAAERTNREVAVSKTIRAIS
jgi:hypothetical protein